MINTPQDIVRLGKLASAVEALEEFDRIYDDMAQHDRPIKWMDFTVSVTLKVGDYPKTFGFKLYPDGDNDTSEITQRLNAVLVFMMGAMRMASTDLKDIYQRFTTLITEQMTHNMTHNTGATTNGTH